MSSDNLFPSLPNRKNMQIVFIGSGKVATHLAQRMKAVGHSIAQIYSRDLQKARTLAASVGASAMDDFSTLLPTADAYIIAISDNAIAETIHRLRDYLPADVFIAHTSGTVSRKVFLPYFSNSGVFYPLQTFSYEKKPNFETLPLCIDGGNIAKTFWFDLGKTICPNTHLVNDEARAKLHIAAVLVNNFSNLLFTAANDILTAENIDFHLLLPLIQETVDKLHHISPEKAQTGPAIRKDNLTIEQHLAYLEEKFPAYTSIYRQLTAAIQLRMGKGL